MFKTVFLAAVLALTASSACAAPRDYYGCADSNEAYRVYDPMSGMVIADMIFEPHYVVDFDYSKGKQVKWLEVLSYDEKSGMCIAGEIPGNDFKLEKINPKHLLVRDSDGLPVVGGDK